MPPNIDNMTAASGRVVRENGTTINVGDVLAEIEDCETVTPSNGSDMPLVATYGAARRLYVGAVATVVIRKATGLQTFENLTPGRWHKMPPYFGIESTGTDTSVQIVAGY